MKKWILENASSDLLSGFSSQNIVNGHASSQWGPIFTKALTARGDFDRFDPNKTVWLGGICSLFTAETNAIRDRKVTFNSVEAFYGWLEEWYPRLDQVHDTIGIPSRACKRMIYVVEDSLFGRRVAQWTGLPEEGCIQAFHYIHERYGVRAIEAWLRAFGYKGVIEVVYTSTIDKELDLLLNIARRAGMRIKPSRRDWLKVNIMYTTRWLDILGLDQGIISEPYHHLLPLDELPFGVDDLWQLGFLPFWSSEGTARVKPWQDVIHRGNWKQFQPDVWTPVNLFFNTPDPFAFTVEVQRHNTLELLERMYENR